MKDIIESQPEDSSLDEILRELSFHYMVDRGIHDSEQGNTIDNEEMKRRINSWQK